MNAWLGCLLVAASLPVAANNVVVFWNEAALDSIRMSRPGPPIVARMLAIAHTCMYDAWAAYDAIALGTRLGAALRRPDAEHTDANKSQAISYAAQRCLADLVPSMRADFAQRMLALGYDPADNSTDPATPTGIGNLAAQAVIDFRHHDGANQLGDLHPGAYSDYTGYTPVNTPDAILDPNRWQPLRVPDGHGGFTVQSFITPHWERVTPFALASATQFDDLIPSQFFYGLRNIGPSGQYVKQVEEILKYSANLTDREKVIAEYWADGPSSETPPGHWSLFAQFVSWRDAHTIDQDAKMFFALENGMFDASIIAWHVKRLTDSVRPVTAVHFLRGGKPVRAWAGPYLGTRIIDGAQWRPYQALTFVTPPFPEYFSGHSIFSRTGADILTAFTGSDIFGAQVTVAAGSSRVEPGAVPATDVTLSWWTFKDAADEAGISRRYGGIHFTHGDIEARLVAPVVAAQVWTKAQSYINGTAN
jgi:hypothetical protein